MGYAWLITHKYQLTEQTASGRRNGCLEGRLQADFIWRETGNGLLLCLVLFFSAVHRGPWHHDTKSPRGAALPPHHVPGDLDPAGSAILNPIQDPIGQMGPAVNRDQDKEGLFSGASRRR